MHTDGLAPLRRFCLELAGIVENTSDEAQVLEAAARSLAVLLTSPAWLPQPMRQAAADGYRQYALHVDPQGRFSVVAFVWGPGQGTPVHDHGTWGLVGVLEGCERGQRYRLGADGGLQAVGDPQIYGPGAIYAVSAAEGDIHSVSNPSPDEVAISIHVYGADIGARERRAFDDSGEARAFRSGYSGALDPQVLWPKGAGA